MSEGKKDKVMVGGGVKGIKIKQTQMDEQDDSKTELKRTDKELKNTQVDIIKQPVGFEYEQAIIPFEQIEKHDKFPNCRQSYPGIEDLARSILEQGLQTPMTVWEFSLDADVQMPWGKVNRRFFLIAGFRRHQAISMLQVENPEYLVEVPVQIFRGSLQNAIFINLTENIQRENPNAVELGAIFHSLVHSHKMLQVDIAKQLGVSEPYVSMILGFYEGKNIAPQLRDMVVANQLNVWLAIRIGSKPIEQQIRIIERLNDAFKDGNGEETVKKIKKELNPKGKKKLRSQKEVQERFDKVLVSDIDNMSNEDKIHLSGILKTMYWMLNEDVDWDDRTLYGWGCSSEVVEEAMAREGRRSNKKKTKE